MLLFVRKLLLTSNIIACLLLISVLLACKKDKLEDFVIHGTVINSCTGKGFPQLKVYLYKSKQKIFNNSAEKIEAVTDAEGNFHFPPTSFTFDDKHSYGFSIPSVSENGYYFSGLSPVELTKEEMLKGIEVGVYGTVKTLSIYLPSHATLNDTFHLIMNQNTIRKYQPEKISVIEFNNIPTNYWNPDIKLLDNLQTVMGWWNVEVDRIHNGNHIVKTDSVFLELGESKDYVIPW